MKGGCHDKAIGGVKCEFHRMTQVLNNWLYRAGQSRNGKLRNDILGYTVEEVWSHFGPKANKTDSRDHHVPLEAYELASLMDVCLKWPLWETEEVVLIHPTDYQKPHVVHALSNLRWMTKTEHARKSKAEHTYIRQLKENGFRNLRPGLKSKTAMITMRDRIIRFTF